jgi:hypothetical protein
MNSLAGIPIIITNTTTTAPTSTTTPNTHQSSLHSQLLIALHSQLLIDLHSQLLIALHNQLLIALHSQLLIALTTNSCCRSLLSAVSLYVARLNFAQANQLIKSCCLIICLFFRVARSNQ